MNIIPFLWTFPLFVKSHTRIHAEATEQTELVDLQ